MRFWDSSAILPLLVREPSTDAMFGLVDADPVMAVWWGSAIECVSALARLERDGQLSPEGIRRAMKRMDTLKDSWHEVAPAEALRDMAIRLLRVHPLRAADAMQLAAAVMICEQRPSTVDFVCLDQRLAAAASREGFNLLSG